MVKKYEHLLDNVRRIHFVGIGGSGMCPLAEILHNEGYEITGSDVAPNPIPLPDQNVPMAYLLKWDISRKMCSEQTSLSIPRLSSSIILSLSLLRNIISRLLNAV